MEPRPQKLTQPDTLAAHGELRFTTSDARHLRGTLFSAQAPIGAVIISGGTGIPQRYYHRFAAFLADHGLTTLTYDYRGIGASRAGSLRDNNATMLDWGSRDLPAALAALREAAPSLPVAAVGHSFGAQALGLTDDSATFDAALLITAMSGYWRHWPAPQRYKMRALWSVVMPNLVNIYGYVPGKFGIGEDLPGAVASQWAGWCLSPDYLVSELGQAALDRFDALSMPLLAYNFTDDDYAPRPAVEAMMSWLPADHLTRRLIAPSDIGQKKIGHLGFFRPQLAPTLWHDAVTFLRGALAR